ncbi:MAG: ribbon-helix-helix protein, CopG family [Chloroflexota bacterium]|nr:ribbon-helix-helix protein, CopG family [Chloroflexota bacterium]
MPLHMVRKQLYIDDDLERALKALAARTARPEAEHVRAALREYLGQQVTAPADGQDPLLGLIDLVDDPEGPDDVAVNHDHYPLWGAEGIMSRVLSVDSGAFIALVYQRDRAHDQMSTHLRTLRRTGALLITSEPVIAETVTRLRYDAGLTSALAFRGILDQGMTAGSLVVRESDDRLRSAAFVILKQYADLRLAYADAVGAAIARERRVDAVFGLYTDFHLMGFALEPS